MKQFFAEKLGLLEQTKESKKLMLLTHILQKPPDQRTDNDLSYVADTIKDLKYFKKNVLDQNERYEFAKGCAQYLRYEYFPKGTQVFRAGDSGNEFFLILKGEVFVYVPKSHENRQLDPTVARMKKEAHDVYTDYMDENMHKFEQETHSATKKKEKFLMRRYSQKDLRKRDDSPKSPRSNPTNDRGRRNILSNDNGIWKGDKKFDLTYDEKLLLLTNKKGLPYFERGLATFKKLNSLSDGDFFGELALIFHTTRTASIIASEDCHLLKISSEDFKTIFGSQINNVVHKLDFISSLFPKLSKKYLMKFCYLLEERTYHHNENLYREGEDPDAVFILRNGEVQLSKIIEGKSKEQHESMIKKKSLARRRLIVANLQTGNFFGDTDIIYNCKRQYTATAYSADTFVYRISKRDFMNVVQVYFTPIVESLKKKAKNKDEWKKPILAKQEEILLADIKPKPKEKIEPEIVGFHNDVLIEKNAKPEPVKIKPTIYGRKVIKKSSILHQTVEIKIIDKPKSDALERAPITWATDLKKQTIFNRQIKFTAKGVEKVKPQKPVSLLSLTEVTTPRKKQTEKSDAQEFDTILKRVLNTHSSKSRYIETEEDSLTSPRYFIPLSSRKGSRPLNNLELPSATLPDIQSKISHMHHNSNTFTEYDTTPLKPNSPTFSKPLTSISGHSPRLSLTNYKALQSLKSFDGGNSPIPRQLEQGRINSLPKMSYFQFDPLQIVRTEHGSVENNELLSRRASETRIIKSRHNLFRPTKKKDNSTKLNF